MPNKKDRIQLVQEFFFKACFYRKRFSAICFLLIMISMTFYMPTHSQEQGGVMIRNYTAKEYKAGVQNWATVQDKNGNMYFGNNNGILQYDGSNWEVIPLPFYSLVRSLDIDRNGRIYVGAINELGYLEPDSLGKMEYTSLI